MLYAMPVQSGLSVSGPPFSVDPAPNMTRFNTVGRVDYVKQLNMAQRHSCEYTLYNLGYEYDNHQ